MRKALILAALAASLLAAGCNTVAGAGKDVSVGRPRGHRHGPRRGGALAVTAEGRFGPKPTLSNWSPFGSGEST